MLKRNVNDVDAMKTPEIGRLSVFCAENISSSSVESSSELETVNDLPIDPLTYSGPFHWFQGTQKIKHELIATLATDFRLFTLVPKKVFIALRTQKKTTIANQLHRIENPGK